MIFNSQSSIKGFTLLETIFAVALILIAIIAIFGLVNFAVSSIGASKNKLVAAELAQEAVESVRWWRERHLPWDSASALGSWYDSDCQNESDVNLCGNFRFGINSTAANKGKVDLWYCPTAKCLAWAGAVPQLGVEVNSVNDVSDFQLWYEPNSKLYNHNNNGNAVNFYRVVNISAPQGGGSYKIVTAQVFWQEGSRLRVIKVVSHLYNWL